MALFYVVYFLVDRPCKINPFMSNAYSRKYVGNCTIRLLFFEIEIEAPVAPNGSEASKSTIVH